MAADVALTPDAVRELLAADLSALRRDPKAVRELLESMLVAFAEHQDKVRHLTRVVEQLRTSAGGGASMGRAIAALAQLSPRDQAQVVTTVVQSVLEDARLAAAEAARVRQGTQARERVLMHAVTALADDDSLDPEAVRALHARLRELTGVYWPQPLDLGDLEERVGALREHAELTTLGQRRELSNLFA